MVKKKIIIAGTNGDFIGRYKPFVFNNTVTWHRIPAKNIEEARQKMLKGTRFKRNEVIVKRYKKRS